MKIICVGMNYASHNKEMQSSLIQERPTVFLKPDISLLKDGKPFFIPDFSSEIQYETEIVVKISRLGKNIAKRFAYRYYEEISVGIDITARDLQREFRANGLPWELSKSFDNSAVVGEFVSLEKLHRKIDDLQFCLDLNQKTVQYGNTKEMLFSVDEIIEYVSRFMTLKIGDLIFTGTPAGVGNLSVNDHLQAYVEGEKLLDFYIK